MDIVCLDLEGVLVPEIWIAFAEASGIPELKRTTRDEPDYDKQEFPDDLHGSVLYCGRGSLLCLPGSSRERRDHRL